MSKLSYVKSEIAAYMQKIAYFFKPEVRITVLVRSPGYDEQDFMMTNDDIVEIAKMVERSKTRPAS